MVGLKGGDRDAIWAGTGWIGLCSPLRLSLRWAAIPGMALVGWMEVRLGSWPRLGLDGTLLVPVVVSAQAKSSQGGDRMWPWYGYWCPWGRPGYWGSIPYGWPWAPMLKEQEIAMLEDEARWLERDLNSIRKRLEELRK